MSEPDRFDARALELRDVLVRAEDDPCADKQDIAKLAAALRAEHASALERAAQLMPIAQGYGPELARKIRALIPPAAAPAAETAQGVTMVTCSTDTEEHLGAHLIRHPTRDEKSWCLDPVPYAPPSAPVAPAPDWSVRAGDKCTRVGCDKRVVAACLPHQFGGCDEHMREHDSRCAFAPLNRTASPAAQGKEKG